MDYRGIVLIFWLLSMYKFNHYKLKEIKDRNQNIPSELKSYFNEVDKLIFKNFKLLILYFILVEYLLPFVGLYFLK